MVRNGQTSIIKKQKKRCDVKTVQLFLLVKTSDTSLLPSVSFYHQKIQKRVSILLSSLSSPPPPHYFHGYRNQSPPFISRPKERLLLQNQNLPKPPPESPASAAGSAALHHRLHSLSSLQVPHSRLRQSSPHRSNHRPPRVLRRVPLPSPFPHFLSPNSLPFSLQRPRGIHPHPHLSTRPRTLFFPHGLGCNRLAR